MLALYVESPFAVCRTFTAGWYRPTATFLTPSAAYGLLLNLAGIETRLREEDEQHSGAVPATTMRTGLPTMKLALGAPTVRLRGRTIEQIPEEKDRFPRVQTVYQQLHNYPVGSSGGDRAATTFGNKYNIAPVRRELLVSLRVIIGIDADPETESRIRHGLVGQELDGRYGLPFVGDNSFLPDRIDVVDEMPEAHWYARVTAENSTIVPRTTRLTITIDRADLSRTKSELFAPSPPTTEIPASAWTTIALPDQAG